VEHFITSYGVAAVFVLMLLESACIPIPSEVTMLVGGAMSAGAFAGSKPSLAVVIIVGVLGNVVGSYLAWAVGRYGGMPLIMRFGRYVFLREHDVAKAHRWFETRGALSVLVGRLLPVIRTFISLPAGIARMNAVKFGIYTTLGCIPWTAALAIVGYQVGDNYKHIANDFHGPTYVIAVVALVVLGYLAYRHVKRSRAVGDTGPAAHDDHTMMIDRGGIERGGPRHRRGAGSASTPAAGPASARGGVPTERPGSDPLAGGRGQSQTRR
jgi:membrane protein DedA with SNARE-associated domain